MLVNHFVIVSIFVHSIFFAFFVVFFRLFELHLLHMSYHHLSFFCTDCIFHFSSFRIYMSIDLLVMTLCSHSLIHSAVYKCGKLRKRENSLWYNKLLKYVLILVYIYEGRLLSLMLKKSVKKREKEKKKCEIVLLFDFCIGLNDQLIRIWITFFSWKSLCFTYNCVSGYDSDINKTSKGCMDVDT